VQHGREFSYPKRLPPSHHGYFHVLATGLDDLKQRLQSKLDGSAFRCDLLIRVMLLQELTDGLGTPTDSIRLAQNM